MKKLLIFGLILNLHIPASAEVTENYVLVSEANYFKPTLVTLGSLNETIGDNGPANAYIFL